MEESEKRRERLKAMRMEAAQAELSCSQVPTTASNHLSNPLVEASGMPSAAMTSVAVTRFDFYTDPMSAFSSGKRKSTENSRNSQGCFSPPITSSSPVVQIPTAFSDGSSPAPAHQFQLNCSSNQRPYGASPQFQTNHSANQRPYGTSPQFQMNRSPSQRPYGTPFPPSMAGPWRSPIGMASSSGQRGSPASFPGTWNQASNMPTFGHPSPRGSSPSPVYGRGGSPTVNSGRGSNRQLSNSASPRSGQGRGRGQGTHSYVSAKEQPQLFYNKSMLEDPWKDLKPVVQSSPVTGKDPKTPDFLKSWLPKSIATKKAKVSEAPADFQYQSSLADCFALSFDEAVKDE